MAIAMVEPSSVRSYLDRVDRFAQGVQSFSERLNAMLQSIGRRTEPVTAAPKQETPVMAAPVRETPQTVSVDDINVDDIIKNIDIGAYMDDLGL